MMPSEQHARMSMSRLPRILLCAGSFQMADCGEHVVGEEVQSSYASEGSLLHLASEQYFKKNMEGTIPKDIVSPELNYEQVSTVMECIEYKENIVRTCVSPEVLIEELVSCKEWSSWLHECEGTSDLIIYDHGTKVLHVVDWKFGQGVFVEVAGNAQAYGYGAGALVRFPDAEYITLHIVQPRLDNYDEITLARKDLLAWIHDTLIPGATLAYSKEAPLNPGAKQCKWCPRKATCKARKVHATEVASKVFAFHQALPDGLDLEELVQLLNESDAYVQYISDLAAFLQRRLLAGHTVPGKKLVHGRSNRNWKDSEKAVEFLEEYIPWDELYTSKLISPSQAEKINRKFKKMEEFQELYDKQPGALTMVDEADKRPAVSVAGPSEVFNEVIKEHNDDN